MPKPNTRRVIVRATIAGGGICVLLSLPAGQAHAATVSQPSLLSGLTSGVSGGLQAVTDPVTGLLGSIVSSVTEPVTSTASAAAKEAVPTKQAAPTASASSSSREALPVTKVRRRPPSPRRRPGRPRPARRPHPPGGHTHRRGHADGVRLRGLRSGRRQRRLLPRLPHDDVQAPASAPGGSTGEQGKYDKHGQARQGPPRLAPVSQPRCRQPRRQRQPTALAPTC